MFRRFLNLLRCGRLESEILEEPEDDRSICLLLSETGGGAFSCFGSRGETAKNPHAFRAA